MVALARFILLHLIHYAIIHNVSIVWCQAEAVGCTQQNHMCHSQSSVKTIDLSYPKQLAEVTIADNIYQEMQEYPLAKIFV